VKKIGRVLFSIGKKKEGEIAEGERESNML
jgi:hypothetical protein